MLWAITTYYNPLGYRTKLENYRRFRSRLGIPLLTVEAAHDGRFQLDGDADILVRRTGGERQQAHYREWAGRLEGALGAGIGCIPGVAFHLWHGDLRNRQYRGRHAGLVQYEFDPYLDITIDAGGCWAWGSKKPEMHEYVLEYFRSRREDGS